MKIRIANAGDIGALVEMQKRLFEELNSFNPESLVRLAENCDSYLEARFETRLLDQNELILVAEEEGKLIGMAAGVVNAIPELTPSKTGYIRDVWVCPEFRRKKVATGLHSELVRYFKLKGAGRFALSYLIKNEPAKIFWQKLGYRGFLITAEIPADD